MSFIIGYTPAGEPVFSMDSAGITKTIPSYLYFWFSDDDDLQAFVAEQNNLTQEYVNWFNAVGLPIYPGAIIVSGFLDWVAEGLYGLRRPVGMDDNTFKRTLTWGFYKGDGKYFNVRWLKRRIMRFLEGTDGTDKGTAATYDVSVTFGVGYHVTIRARRITITGAVYDGWGRSDQLFPNGLTQNLADHRHPFLYGNTCYNGNPPEIVFNPTDAPVSNVWNIALLAPFTAGPALKAGVADGTLELPFQLQFTVTL